MTLYRTIENQIQKSVVEFCRLLAEKHSLSEEELLDTWKTVAGAPATNKNKKGEKKPRKSSAWQNFAKATRPLVKTEMPDLTFGEMSSEIGRRWRLLSDKEKAQYASKATTPKPLGLPVATEIRSPVETTPSIKNTPVAIASPVKSPSPLKTKPKKKQGKKKVEEIDEEASPYEKMSVKELKAVCKEKGLTIKGLTKKAELLEALRIADEANHSSDDDDDNGSVASDDTSSSYHPDLEEEEDDLLA